jgi:hypothetical protein
LEGARLEADAGTRDLIFLDESGFAPTMPTGYTWSRTGQRAAVPREDTKDRRVNVLGALIAGTAPDLVWEHAPGKIDAAVLLEFVCSKLAGLPPRRGRVITGRGRHRHRAAGLAAVPPVHGCAGQRLCARRQGVQGPPQPACEDRGRPVLPPAAQPRAQRHRTHLALRQVRGLSQRAYTKPRAKLLRPGCGEGAPELEPHVPHHSANAWRTASM